MYTHVTRVEKKTSAPGAPVWHIAGLRDWIAQLRLEAVAGEIEAWAHEMGAANLKEPKEADLWGTDLSMEFSKDYTRAPGRLQREGLKLLGEEVGPTFRPAENGVPRRITAKASEPSAPPPKRALAGAGNEAGTAVDDSVCIGLKVAHV
eukprot:s857_g27.t1